MIEGYAREHTGAMVLGPNDVSIEVVEDLPVLSVWSPENERIVRLPMAHQAALKLARQARHAAQMGTEEPRGNRVERRGMWIGIVAPEIRPAESRCRYIPDPSRGEGFDLANSVATAIKFGSAKELMTIANAAHAELMAREGR